MNVDAAVLELGAVAAWYEKGLGGLVMTYRCPFVCRHCFICARPSIPEGCVSCEDGIAYMRRLRETDRVIHITGGEAFLHYDRLLAICEGANESGSAPHFIQTNGFWCTDEEETRERYNRLKDAGVLGMYISYDPHHLRYIDVEVLWRAIRLANEVFGSKHVQPNDVSPESLERLEASQRETKSDAGLLDYEQRLNAMWVGRAGDILADARPRRPLADLVDDTLWTHKSTNGEGCIPELELETLHEIRVDLHGNIVTGCGVILGHMDGGSLQSCMAKGTAEIPLIDLIKKRGPYGLHEMASERGFVAAEGGYPHKCNYCWKVRKHLRPDFPDTFGPAEVYG